MKRSRRIISVVGLLLCITFAVGGANELLEAQQIALELSGELRPPEDLTELIQNDLAAIRAAYYPQIADISYRPIASPDQIIVGLTDQAMQQFRNGQYHELDQLNALYGVIEIDDPFHRISAIILNFDQVYNTPLLADLYIQDDPPGMRYAQPNYYGGYGSTISAAPPLYTFIRAWGDCPAGCIYHDYWEFSVQDGQVDLIPEPATLGLMVIGGLAILRRRLGRCSPNGEDA